MARPRAGNTRMGRRDGASRLPSDAELADFVRSSRSPVGAREAARAFGLTPADRPALRTMLRSLTGETSPATQDALPEITVVERFGSDSDGVPLARLVAWPGAGEAPIVRLDETGAGPALPIGAKAAARLVRLDNGEIEGRVIRRLDPEGGRVVGVFRREREGGRVVPADRRNRNEYQVAPGDVAGVEDDDLVVAEPLSRARLGLPRARIVERIGPVSAPGAISRLAIAACEIPTMFSAAALTEAEAATPTGPDGRVDLRDLPLVTIDGSDARDFDDAVWAEPDPDPQNAGGWHLVVAIADVAWYVRPGSALDREAELRGNSVYFPDRVVPMLPEALSNELCSLKPGADRACLAVHLWIDPAGRKRRHRFERALMRSTARLTYEEVQAARDNASGQALPVAFERLDWLYGAYTALAGARAQRGALELDLREDRVVLDGAGRPVAVVPAERFDSHRLIEEFMVLANVAAAEELEALRRPCMYRVHDSPDPAKLAALQEFLVDIGVPGLAFAKGQAPKPALFNQILQRAAATPVAALVNELILRSQAQAAYSPDNIGHFGLGLRRYAHFTSPIRRYADLLVHRALTGGGTASESGHDRLAALGEHISATERRAVAAERMAVEHYRASLLAGSVGGVFAASVSGVADFGLFVTTSESGATGLVPLSSLGDYYDWDRGRHRLVGRRSGRVFRLGDDVAVRLVEADGVSGRLVFGLEENGATAPPRLPRHKLPRNRRNRRG